MWSFLIVIIAAALSFSCNIKSNQEDSGDTSAITVEDPTAEQIAEEKRILEKERIKQALLKEDEDRKRIDAKAWIGSFSDELMKGISPMSGQNLAYAMLDESSYNSDTQTLTAVFQTEWDAIPSYLGGEPQRHIYKGKYILYGTGERRSETLYMNTVLADAVDEIKKLGKLNDLLNKMNSSQNSE